MVSDRINVARIYDAPSGDAHRVLVDRVWPRGVRKDEAALDEWCTDVAPSTQLRKWYGHDPARFAEFARRYREELAEPARAAIVQRLREVAQQRSVVLLTATKELEISQAAVLAEVLRG